MKKTVIALGVLAGAAILTPAFAEDFRVDAPGVHVGVGDHYGWHHRHYRTEGYSSWGAERCRMTVVRHANGSVTKVRRCRD